MKVGEEVLQDIDEEGDGLKNMIDKRLDAISKNIKSAIPGKKGTTDTAGSYNKRNQMH